MVETSPRAILSNQLMEKKEKNDGKEKRNQIQGPVAQRITRLTTNQEIASSNPSRLDSIFHEDKL